MASSNCALIYVKTVGLNPPGLSRWTNFPMAGETTLEELLTLLSEQNHIPDLMEKGLLKKGFSVLVNGMYCPSLKQPLHHDDRVLVTLLLVGG